MTDKAKYLVCDVCFNDQIIQDVKLSETCTLGKIVEGLWEDEKFYSAALNFLKSKEDESQAVKDLPLRSCHGLNRSIVRAYVAIRVLPNWKWLEFKDFVSDFENQKESLTIGDVLGDLSNGVHKPILNVVPKSEMEADDQEVKTILQDLLTTKSLATLSAAGCPLSKGMMSLIGQDKYACRISYDKRERFVHWLRRQDLEQEMLVSPAKAAPSPSQSMTPIKIAKSRVTFHPEGEITKLEDWFNRNQRPNKEMIMEYTDMLNKGRLGKCKRMLLPDSIAVWFKNRRAKAKKEESASHEQILSQHIVVASRKSWEVAQLDDIVPTMVPLSIIRKESGSLGGIGDQQSHLLHSSYPTTETNTERMIEGMANVTQPLENTSTNSDTIFQCGEETVLHCMQQLDQNGLKTVHDQEMVDSQNTTNNQGAHSLENGDKETGEQLTETSNKSGTQVKIENADKKNDGHMEMTDSNGKFDSKTTDINNHENSIYNMYADSHVNSEETKTENQMIEGGVSSLKHAREDQDMVDDNWMQLRL